MTKTQPLPNGTRVQFNIAQGLATGTAVIAEAEYEDGWFYRLENITGDAAHDHRNNRGELWVCEFEVRCP